MKAKAIFSVLFILFFNVSFANTGNTGTKSLRLATIEGRVVDKDTKEALGGVRIKVEGSNIELYSDPQGNFRIEEVLPGEYKIKLSFISYKDKEVDHMILMSGSSSSALKIELDPEI